MKKVNTYKMKKLLSILVLSLLFSGSGYAYKNIKLLDKIDLTIDADIQMEKLG